jgi:hypothetical protein
MCPVQKPKISGGDLCLQSAPLLPQQKDLASTMSSLVSPAQDWSSRRFLGTPATHQLQATSRDSQLNDIARLKNCRFSRRMVNLFVESMQEMAKYQQ